jgi:ATP-dependent Clp protease ATP-binding subunit ClpC
MNGMINLNSARARKARLGGMIGAGGAFLLAITGGGLSVIGLYCIFLGDFARVGYLSLALAIFCLMIAVWYRYDLKNIPVKQPAEQLDDILDAAILAKLKAPITPRSVWDAVAKNSEASFIASHLLLDWKYLSPLLDADEQKMPAVWQQAIALMAAHNSKSIHAGTLATAIIMTSPAAEAFLTQNRLRKEEAVEVLSWCDRTLDYLHQPKPMFGGIGRDWASGFTPTLERFGENISRTIELRSSYEPFCAHSDLLTGVMSSLSRGSGVALVGPDGTGKDALIDALAQRLLLGQAPELRYYKIMSLNASQILSSPGAKLEPLMLTLFGEAVAAGNTILYLDDAELFFSSGVGAFDMSQILLPVLKNRRVKIIASFTPVDWQQLQAVRPALANSFASIAINEPSEQATFKVLEDAALLIEHRNKLLVTYEAIREAYRLSGQYMQERAYPGKAISLLEQSLPYAEHSAVTAQTIQAAIEKTKGVKVSAAQAPEAEMLLQLEDRIHSRMINQKRAVNVVAAALRRGRAGVSNPKRPVGSFLFLGPTGVGKTELARSLAAVYFGDEQQMIRLDMSEYQQPNDISRLLAAGGQSEHSLLLSIREQPFSVVLLDEIEKAHPSVLNLMLQMLDEGQLTDEQGRPASFRSSIIIATSNAGAADIAQRVKEGNTLDDFERPLIDKLISAGQFKPELVNRFDEVVLFRPLNEAELAQVAAVMLDGVNKTLATQQIRVELTPAALTQIVHQGYDPEFGARPMRRIIQKTVENAVAVKILRGEAKPGNTITLDIGDLSNS